jgi:hypothetical protein
MDIFRNFLFLYNVNGYHRSPPCPRGFNGTIPEKSMERIPELNEGYSLIFFLKKNIQLNGDSPANHV